MIEYNVILHRHKGSTRPDVCIFQSENRNEAIKAMRRYGMKEGFVVRDPDGMFTIATIALVAKEPIAGAPILSVELWEELFDVHGERK